MHGILRLSRRGLLGGAAATAALCSMSALPAFAKPSGTMVASVFGGDYGDILRQSVDVAILAPIGVTVAQDISSTEARQTKLRTERQRRKSSMDVAVLADLDMYPMAKIGAFSAVSAETVPRISAVLPALKKEFSVPQIFSYIAILYNPAKIETPPTSFADLWKPEYKGRVGISDNLHVAVSAVATLVAGGTMSDLSAGREKLLELKNQQQAKVFPSNEAIAASLKSEEIWITVNYVARAYSWRKAGVPITHAIAKEGAIPIAFEMAVPTNAANAQAGFAYLNAALEPAAQTAFAEKMGYLPTVTDANLPPELEKQIGLPISARDNLVRLDNEYLMEHQAEILDFWNRSFKG